ncbi:alpha/beta hydrolase family esterase [Azospirillum sp. ST 5-10]|uniref:alpha/beta hydrolase family esterase n=1 Tax=unclassified Azospirillum TaxID=2630922 RepID=UPI003F4A021D
MAIFVLAGAAAGQEGAHPSAACGRPPPAAAPAAVTVGGRARGVIVVPPADYDPGRPHDLVIAFHGRTTANVRARRYYDLEGNAARATIFAYPAGRQDAEGRYTWAAAADPPGGPGGAALFDSLLRALGDTYCLDRRRVFVVGHSLGASVANSLACARGAAIRAVATVGGGITGATGCSGPVAAMVLHNPRDRLVPLSEGLRVRRSLLTQNGFAAGSEPASPRRFNCRRYGPEDAADPVLWCPHADDVTGAGRFYPHQWPAGTGAAIMAFFAGLA